MWKYNYTNELYHFGIPGMRWGKHKVKAKDHDLTKTKSKHRINLEKKYIKKGMSQEEAARAASKRIRTEKILAVIGGTAVAAVAAKLIYNQIRINRDETINAGKMLQRIEKKNTSDLHDVFYATNNKFDNDKYKGRLGFLRATQTGGSYKMDIGVNKDIKIAGRKKALQAYSDLMRIDKEFRDHANSVTKGIDYTKNLGKSYDRFNANIVYKDSNNIKQRDAFFRHLKAQGYGGIRDVNDMKFSGYKAKNPLILFGQNDKLTVKKVEGLTIEDMTSGIVKDVLRQNGDRALKAVGPITLLSALKMSKNDFKKNKGVKQNVAIQ